VIRRRRRGQARWQGARRRVPSRHRDAVFAAIRFALRCGSGVTSMRRRVFLPGLGQAWMEEEIIQGFASIGGDQVRINASPGISPWIGTGLDGRGDHPGLCRNRWGTEGEGQGIAAKNKRRRKMTAAHGVFSVFSETNPALRFRCRNQAQRRGGQRGFPIPRTRLGSDPTSSGRIRGPSRTNGEVERMGGRVGARRL